MKNNTVIYLILFLVSLISVSALDLQAADEAPIFGPVTIERAKGKPTEVTYRFPKLPSFAAPFRLIVINGDSSSHNRISSASISLNGKVVLSTSNFNQNIDKIVKMVDLIENNVLTVKLQSVPESFFKVSVVGQKIEQQEQVLDHFSATVSPSGGAVNLENFATVNLTEEPLRPHLTLKLEKIIAPAKLELYATETIGAGPVLSEQILRITSSENITNSIAVIMQIPQTLVNNLPQGHNVELFAEFTQLGADGEHITTFERLGASYDAIRGIAYANIPQYAFTPSNSVTTCIVIGSYKDAPTSQVTGDNIVPAQAVNAGSSNVVPLSVDLTFSIPKMIANPLNTTLADLGPNGDFGPRIHPFTGQPGFHNGVDLNPYPDAPNVPVYSVLPGTVTDSGVGSEGLGNRIWIDHGNGLTSLYAHLSQLLVSTGTYITDINTQIGVSGKTSNGKYPDMGDHLHFAYKYNGSPVDPMLFIDGIHQEKYLSNLSVVALVNGNAIEATRQQVSGALLVGSSAFLKYQSQLDLVPLNLSVGSTNQLSIVVQGANGTSTQIATVPLTIMFPLRVMKSGSGSGTVVSAPPGINCGELCFNDTASFDMMSLVRLTATPSLDSVFIGWEGDCVGTTPTVDVSFIPSAIAKTCTAIFGKIGDVVSLSIGLNFENTPDQSSRSAIFVWGITKDDLYYPPSLYYPPGTLLAFNTPLCYLTCCDWDGAYFCQDNIKLYPMDKIQKGETVNLRVDVVTPSSISAICNIYCPSSSPPQFIGWSGDCSGVDLSVSVKMTTDKQCTANFK